jgi:hypothetical protein
LYEIMGQAEKAPTAHPAVSKRQAESTRVAAKRSAPN